MTKLWRKEYRGFESLVDIERDIFEAIEYEDVIPSGEPQGTLIVTLEYVPEDIAASGEFPNVPDPTSD